MTNPESAPPPDPIEKVLADFDQKKDMLETFCVKTETLIQDCLDDAQVRYQSIQSRVKRREKLRIKYLDPKKGYKQLDDITDQAALRIITYYEDEVDRVAEVIKQEFHVIPEQSVDKRETDPDRFGYYALNFACTHSPKRQADVQYKKFAELIFEIQITSVLRHAWSEIEHEWYDLKDSYPDEIKRRFYRQAALLEIAESEFLSLRNLRISYKRSVDVRVDAEVPGLPIDAVSLKAFMLRETMVRSMDERIALIAKASLIDPDDALTARRAKATQLAGFLSLTGLRDSLRQFEPEILQYVTAISRIPFRMEGRPLRRGVSIHNLAMLVILNQEEQKMTDSLKTLNVQRGEIVDKQIQIARQVMAKHMKDGSGKLP
jgi:putative GTP pyrophosphokinase